MSGIEIAEDRNPSTRHFGPLFDYAHLPEDLQEIAGPCAALAEHVIGELPDGPELSTGLRKILEAKDCLVRARVLARSEGR